MILNETKIVETSTKSQFVLIRKCFIILLVLVLLSIFIGSINFANNFDFRPIQIIESIKLSFYSEHERIVQKNQNKSRKTKEKPFGPWPSLPSAV